MSLNSGLNPNVVKTALDDVFFQPLEEKKQPGYVDAASSMTFRQDTADSSAVIMEVFKGTGNWDQLAEEVEITEKTPRVANTKTFSVVSFKASVKIPHEFFEDQKHGVYEMMVESMARRAVTTRDKNAFAVYRNAFTSATTADGGALISSHTNLNGDTVSNLLTGALSETTLYTGIQTLYEMKAQDGVIEGFQPSVLMVAPAKFKLACEIVDSELRSGTANNDMNVYSSKYGIYVATSPWLGTAGGGSDTAWYLLSTRHSIMRYVREAVNTDLIEPKYSSNDVWVYKGRFREVVGAMSYEGIVGSTG
ncbi:MAG: Mu-like prophage major head subunit gpT family protein [Blastocatellia bacterium]